MKRKLATDVVIAGGGIAGLMLALILGRRGIQVILVEKNKELITHQRGEILQPNGLKILEKLGLLEEIRSHGYEARVFHFYETGGDFLCDIRYDRLASPLNYALIASPYHLQELLLRKAVETGKVEILWDTEFQELVWKEKSVCGMVAKQRDSSLEIEGKMVVGGDGGRSSVRKALGIKTSIYEYRDGYFTVRLDRPAGFNQDARYYVGNRQILALFPVSKTFLYLLYLIPKNKQEEIRQKGIETWKKEVLAIDPVVEEPLRNITWESVHYMPIFRIRTSSWVADGAALLGDAAHSFNPHVAQGRNQAMEDAVALAATLERCFNKNDFSRKALLPYEQARKGTALVYERLGDELTLFWNADLKPLVWIRNRVFRQLHKKPKLMYKMLTTVAGVKIDPFTFLDRFRALGVLPGS
ncbi:MAG: FAD-dependent monooxygenase [Nitrospirae bacterium]|nr:FAD-dependent monooxygenase [Nitrospirota bacterium]MBI3352188.1 FAD-dependent monooxygenase [Nitrospirota bacterium]